MDALLDKALRQAPKIMHHLFALNGIFLSQYMTIYKENEWCLRILDSNKILAALPTEESKAAYVLRTVAAGLEEVGKAMGSSVGVANPPC